MPAQKLLSIKEASELLSVSEKTLRRWEKKGLLTPFRTSGGHRRYMLDVIKSLRRKKSRRVRTYDLPSTKLPPQEPQMINKATGSNAKNDFLSEGLALNTKIKYVTETKERLTKEEILKDLTLIYKSTPLINRRIIFWFHSFSYTFFVSYR